MRISDWSSDVCSSDLKTTACGGQFPDNQFASFEDCKAIGNLGVTTDGIGVIRYKGEEPSWTIGLDYRLSDDALLYIVSRRGYSAGAPNTPLFESPYTTGGIAPGCRSEEHTSELQYLMRIS